MKQFGTGGPAKAREQPLGVEPRAEPRAEEVLGEGPGCVTPRVDW